ncbi:hypothetical protein B0H13DRAFT_1861970 [Mycena leptocephala]|nr:hypothetical protein B0H13DRAFT_1861970 [Mycena leptocephala]
MPHDAEARSKHSPAEQESLDGAARRLMDFQGDHVDSEAEVDDPKPHLKRGSASVYVRIGPFHPRRKGTSRNHQYFVGWTVELMDGHRSRSIPDHVDESLLAFKVMCRVFPHARYIPSGWVGFEPMCSGLHGMYRVWNVSLVRVLLIPDCKQQHAEVRFSLSSYRFDLPLTTFLRGETEKTAQTADAADGLYNQIAGTANELMGQVMGDSTKEASGKEQETASQAKKEANKPI